MEMMVKRRGLVLALACGLALMSCSPIYRSHGYVPPAEDLNALVVGVDSRATVDETIGQPSMSGMAGGGDYYYVRSRFRAYGAMRPEVVERKVVAISFRPDNVIANIEEFGLENGQIVPLSRRVTDNSVVAKGFLRQLIGNIGQINPSDLF